MYVQNNLITDFTLLDATQPRYQARVGHQHVHFVYSPPYQLHLATFSFPFAHSYY